MDNIDQQAPTALVTGGSRGIGKAIAMKLAQCGFQILLTCASRITEAEAVAEEIIKNGGKAKAFILDIGKPEEVEKFFTDHIKNQINLHVLVNNAGITHDGLLLRMKTESIDKVLDVDLRGPFICAREAAKIMSKNRYGRIINITSVVGQMGNAGQTNYSAAKAGLIGLTKACAKELGSRDITVNAVAPGFIETDMTAALDENLKKEYVKQIPLGRFGQPEDVAQAVAFLASADASYITGQVLAVNGGIYC